MKKVLAVLILLYSINTYAQEEFLGRVPGISGSYIHTNRPNDNNINSFKFNAYFNEGLSLNVSSNVYNGYSYPTIGLNFQQGNKENDTYLLGLGGLSFSNAEDFIIVGFSGGVMQCIHTHRKYPLSLQGKVRYQTFYYTDNSIERRAILGLGYNQALNSQKDIYPYLGLEAGIDVLNIDNSEASNTIFTVTIGFNINLGD